MAGYSRGCLRAMRRNTVPRVEEPLPFSLWIKQEEATLKCIAHPYAGKSWREYMPLPSDMLLLIGPEGGFKKKKSKRPVLKI